MDRRSMDHLPDSALAPAQFIPPVPVSLASTEQFPAVGAGSMLDAFSLIDAVELFEAAYPPMLQFTAAYDAESSENFSSISAPDIVRQRKFNFAEMKRRAQRLAELGADDSIATFLTRHLMIAGRFRLGWLGQLARQTPRLTSRYIREYLSLGFSVSQRRDIFVHHHRFIEAAFGEQLFNELLSETGCILWRMDAEYHEYQIRLEIDRSMHGEGDLVLGFYASKTRLYDLSLSIAPGAAIGAGDESAIIMSRVQGRKLFSEIRTATKACSDILPSHLLLAAAEGLAAALSITTLCGVAGERQVSYRWLKPGAYRFDYDAFWGEFLEARRGDLYWGAAPIRRKPITDVTASHRRRAMRKRRFRDALTEQVREALATRLR